MVRGDYGETVLDGERFDRRKICDMVCGVGEPPSPRLRRPGWLRAPTEGRRGVRDRKEEAGKQRHYETDSRIWPKTAGYFHADRGANPSPLPPPAIRLRQGYGGQGERGESFFDGSPGALPRAIIFRPNGASGCRAAREESYRFVPGGTAWYRLVPDKFFSPHTKTGEKDARPHPTSGFPSPPRVSCPIWDAGLVPILRTGEGRTLDV
jgi:hypothetical protein